MRFVGFLLIGMSCTSPILISVEGIDSSGKEILKLGNAYFKTEDGKIKNNSGVRRYTVPCGHCLQCRRAQAKEWSHRLMMEMQYHDSSYFATLTYDDAHIPVRKYFDDATGEVDARPSLSKRDIQLFFKRLRKAFPDDKIRFYIAGEYGPQTERPHYHAIIFGLHLSDLQPFGSSETGNQYYISESFNRCWSLGFTSVEPANEHTCMYTTSYVTSKLGAKPNLDYELKGICPPFALSSRKPGIGVRYLYEHKDDILKYDRIYLSTNSGGISFKPPRYFYQKVLSPEEYEPVRHRHIDAAVDAVLDLERSSDLDIFDQNIIKERLMIASRKQRNDF